MSRSLRSSVVAHVEHQPLLEDADAQPVGAGFAADQDGSRSPRSGRTGRRRARARPRASDAPPTPRPARCRRCGAPVGIAGAQPRRFSRIETDRPCASRPSASASASAAGPSAASASGVQDDERGALEEIGDAEPAREARRARGRQHVVGAGDIVADRLGRMAAEEDRAGMTDLLRQRLGRRHLHGELDMLGGDARRRSARTPRGRAPG